MFKSLLLTVCKRVGYDLVPIGPTRDMDTGFLPVYSACRPFTMTSAARMFALFKAVEYVVQTGIPGDFVECGVWRGGSAMVIAYTLQRLGVSDRRIWLYDTFTGMSAPTDLDHKLRSTEPAMVKWNASRRANHVDWCYSPLDEVRANMESTGYPRERLVYVRGKVEETLPSQAPDRVALLRLDTDFYESTAHSLRCLYPQLAAGGVLILDDYGSWHGAKVAVDEYVQQHGVSMLLNRIDNAGRVGVKCR